VPASSPSLIGALALALVIAGVWASRGKASKV
jgi:hypothetical protein